MAGQSNMVGNDPTPFNFGTDARILNFSDGLAGSALNRIEVAVDPLRHTKNKSANVPRTNMGRPFAHALLEKLPAGDKILLVNRAWNGTSIEQWNKNNTTYGRTGHPPESSEGLTSNLYHTAIDDYKAALEAVKNAGDTPIKAGIIWLQGEANAHSPTDPEAFRAATDDVLDSMRHDLGDPAMKVLVLEIYQGYAGQTGKLIRDQLRLVAKDLNCGFVSSDGATVMPDGVHLTTASHEIMGARAAEVYLGLQ